MVSNGNKIADLSARIFRFKPNQNLNGRIKNETKNVVWSSFKSSTGDKSKRKSARNRTPSCGSLKRFLRGLETLKIPECFIFSYRDICIKSSPRKFFIVSVGHKIHQQFCDNPSQLNVLNCFWQWGTHFCESRSNLPILCANEVLVPNPHFTLLILVYIILYNVKVCNAFWDLTTIVMVYNCHG